MAVRRRRVRVTPETRVHYRGRRRRVRILAEEHGMAVSRVVVRLRQGWTVERALTEPLNNNGRPPRSAPTEQPFSRDRFEESLAELLPAWRTWLASGSV